MSDPVRFKMKPQDDLSSRADFTYDIMQSLSKELQTQVSDLPEVKAVHDRATVMVNATGTLTQVSLSVSITQKGEKMISPEERDAVGLAVRKVIHEGMKSRVTRLLQESTSRARGKS